MPSEKWANCDHGVLHFPFFKFLYFWTIIFLSIWDFQTIELKVFFSSSPMPEIYIRLLRCWGMSWSWVKWTLSLWLSAIVQLQAGYLHSSQLQIHSAPCQEKAATLGPEIYSRVGKWQLGQAWIWSISPADGILTTPRHPLNVASSNTRDKDVNAPSLSFYSNLSPSQGSWCWILYFWRIQSTGMVLVGKKPSWLP